MIRLMHISDLHLNFINGNYAEPVRERLRQGLIESLAFAVETAISFDVHLMVISGDILDTPQMGYDLDVFLREQAQRLEKANIALAICHGNHDPSKLVDWKPIFKKALIFETPLAQTHEILLKNGEKIFITGCGFEEKAVLESPIDKFPQRKKDTYHIGVIHGTIVSTDFQGHEPYMPLKLGQMAARDYHYWAMGHIHKRQIFRTIKGAYAGSMQGQNKKETGVKGGYIVTVETPTALPQIQFVPLSKIRFETIVQKVSKETESLFELGQELYRKLNSIYEKGMEKTILLQWILEGQSPLYSIFQNKIERESFFKSIQEQNELLNLEVCWEGLYPVINEEAYKNASPFLKTIGDIIAVPEKRKAFLQRAAKENFLDMPVDLVKKQKWLEEQLFALEDEWLYRLVKIDENKEA